MTILGTLLAALGVADLVRAWIGDRKDKQTTHATAGFIAAAAGSITTVAITIAGGLPWPWAIGIIVGLFGWLAVTGKRNDRPTAQWPLLVLAMTITSLTAFVHVSIQPDSAISLWYDTLPYELVNRFHIEVILLGLGCAFALLETSNVIVRIVLDRMTVVDSPAPPAVEPATKSRTWNIGSLRKRRAESATEVKVETEEFPLKGGRLIGPFERLFLLCLALAGQYTAIGAVVAAKGIIRFPEISRDTSSGFKAEYFLVGSFVSWILVLIAVVLLATSIGISP